MKKDYIKPLANNTENIFDTLDHNIYLALEYLSKIPEKGVSFFYKSIENLHNNIYDRLNKDTSAGWFLRHISLPYSLAIPKVYKYLFYNEGKELIFAPGVHMVRASVGGGKSLLSFILAELYLEKTGLATYFTSPVEKPQITKDGKFKYVYHRYIDLDNYFVNGERVKRFNTKKYKMIMKDERHLDFNPRLNNTKEYKNKFIPQQKSEILMRHEGITHIYKFSQYTKLDGQDMQALTYMHEVETKKDIPTKIWLSNGTFKYIPVALKITTYIIDVSFEGSMDRKKVGSCKLDVPGELLERFDTHAEKYQIEGLPVDFK